MAGAHQHSPSMLLSRQCLMDRGHTCHNTPRCHRAAPAEVRKQKTWGSFESCRGDLSLTAGYGDMEQSLAWSCSMSKANGHPGVLTNSLDESRVIAPVLTVGIHKDKKLSEYLKKSTKDPC